MTEKQQEEVKGSPRIKIRIESLSDLVFGLALSIGSLEFLSSQTTSAYDLARNVLFFGFSFIILVFTWLGYSRTEAVLPRQSDASIYLNILLLFLVAIEPYLFFVLVSGTAQLANVSSIAYALDVGPMFLIQAALANLVIKEDKETRKLGKQEPLHPEIIERFRRAINYEIGAGVVYLISVLPIFWEIQTPIGQFRFVLWWVSFGLFFAARSNRRINEKKETEVAPS